MAHPLKFIVPLCTLVCGILCGCQFLPGTDAYKEEKAKDAAAALLIDPSSAQFRNVVAKSNAVCGEINGKNRMGAYVGFTRFYVTTDTWTAHLDPQFDESELASSEDLCASMQSNSYSSVSSTASACNRAAEQRLTQALQESFRWDVGDHVRACKGARGLQT